MWPLCCVLYTFYKTIDNELSCTTEVTLACGGEKQQRGDSVCTVQACDIASVRDRRGLTDVSCHGSGHRGLVIFLLT